ncbi:helix-turn-helix domain-containing protein [Nonomuraea sp. NPDC050556]|uniref:helix-turn-helix domain-containing protein n=1 Tax=Nonomuraea sp. NPDC050556 TaxID=3364369 RepID=UPI0037892716
MIFGKLLRKLRLRAGLTQEQLAAQSGLSARSISRLELGLIAAPRVTTLALLAESLGLDTSEREQLVTAAQDGGLSLAQPRQSQEGHWQDVLIGRDKDLKVLLELLVKHRMVTLTGPGGAGKSALAFALAARLDRVSVIELGPLPDEPRSGDDGEHLEIITAAFSEALGVRSHQLLDELRAGSRTLLVDNSEHVLRTAGQLITQITNACPDVTLLITSRQPLSLPGEAVWNVAPLAVPQAVELFRRRAAQHVPDLDLSSELPVVAELCAGLDGLPLAVELAAARLRTMSPGAAAGTTERPARTAQRAHGQAAASAVRRQFCAVEHGSARAGRAIAADPADRLRGRLHAGVSRDSRREGAYQARASRRASRGAHRSLPGASYSR